MIMTGNRSFATRLATVLLVLAIAGVLHAQDCVVTGSTATDAAGNSMPITTCTGPNDNSPRYKAPPPKPDVWGAIAVSPSLAWGSSWNFNSQQAAEAEALRRCNQHTPANTHKAVCKIAVSVADVCVSLATSFHDKIYAIGGPAGAVNFAENNATLLCKRAGGRSCAITSSFCADGVRHVLQGQTIFSNGNPIFVPNGQTAAPLRRR
jgi:hypothetical protein